jgi:dolichol-phosphate mannosyltransferase
MKANPSLPETQVAVVIPAYRAAAHIAEVLRGIPEFVARIVVVDDCSPDETAAVVQEESRRDPRIRLLRHEENQGVGGAVLTGYAEALRLGAEIVVKMDSDGQMDPVHLPALIAPIARGEADYAKGNRYLHARQLRSMPMMRRVGNLGLSFLTKLASGYWNMFDPTNGYTAIHASLIPLLNKDGIARRYFFESSMLLELSLLRAVVRDVYIPARYGDETSNLSIFKTLRQFPAALAKGFWRRLWIQYFVRDFSIASLYAIAGLCLVVSGAVFGAVHWHSSAQYGVATPTGTVMLAALPVLLGIQLLLQAVSLDIQNQPVHCLHRDASLKQDSEPAALAPPRLSADEHSENPLPRQRAA